jgi:hypothetical protein
MRIRVERRIGIQLQCRGKGEIIGFRVMAMIDLLYQSTVHGGKK